MEDNQRKTIKISLKSFIIIVISIVVVLFLGWNLYAKAIGKPNIISKIQALTKSEKKENNDEVNGDQKRNIDLGNSNNELDDETAKELFEKGADEIRQLKYSGLMKDEYEVNGKRIEKNINGTVYVKTNEKYEKVVQKYGEIFTDKALENVLAERFVNIDGILYVSDGGASGWEITNVKVERINEGNGEISYRATYNDVAVNDEVIEEKQTCEFKIKKVDGEYKISETNYCDIDQKQNVYIDNNNNELDNETAKELFEKGADEIRKLEYLGLMKDEYEVDGKRIEKNINGTVYVKTNEKYETVVQKYGEIFTDKALENVLAERFVNIDGILYVSGGGASGWEITNVEVEKINEENGEILYRATYNDIAVNDEVIEEKQTCEFKIKKVDGEYKISETNYCDVDKK